MNKLFDIFEQTSDAVFGIDKQGHVHFWNSACSTLFGYSFQEIEDKHCSGLLCGVDLQERKFCSYDCPVPKQNNKQSTVQNFDLIVKQSSGNSVMVNINAYFTPASWLKKCKNISVFFSLRRVNSHRLIQRMASSSCHIEDNTFRLNNLTTRESAILRLASEGETTSDIASQLCISQSTVRNHFKNIYKKLDVHSRAQAIGYAMSNGLI